MCQTKGVVGIFSMEDRSTYDWLIQLLLSSSEVKDVRPVCTSRNAWNLRNEINQCTFAILYHTQNRGRLNVTDVTDQLYERELELLHEILGRKNVIVVMDDVEDSSDEEKTQILMRETSMGLWAQDVILFRSQEKESLPVSYENQKWLRTWRKRKQITNLIKAHNRRLLGKKLAKNTSIFIALIFTIILGICIVLAIIYGILENRNYFNYQSTTISPGNVTHNM